MTTANLHGLLPSEFLKYVIGAESLFDRLHNTSNWHVQSGVSNYPPYNIVKIDQYTWNVEIALSGFSEDDIEVEVNDGVLEVRTVFDQSDTREYVFRGLAKRKFTRRFALGDDVVVRDAAMDNGLLTISIERIVPEEKKPRLIPINKHLAIEDNSKNIKKIKASNKDEAAVA